MKILMVIMAVISLCFSINIFAKNMDDCVSINKTWGDKCGSEKSVQVKVKNQCSENVYVKMCVERENGTWECGSDPRLEPGETNTGFYTCKATGNYKYATCTGGFKECGFPSP